MVGRLDYMATIIFCGQYVRDEASRGLCDCKIIGNL